jgi:hypothetical protein
VTKTASCLRDATVTLDGVGPRTTDGNGFANFGMVAAGTYGLRIAKPDVVSMTDAIVVRAGMGNAVSYIVRGARAPTDWMEMFASEAECERTHPEWECGETQVRGKIEFFRRHRARPTPTQVAPYEPRAAEILRVDAPDKMVGGRTYRVGVEARNLGTMAWTSATSFLLGDWIGGTTGVHRWGVGRATLPHGAQVRRGEHTRFEFDVVAPTTPGTYAFQWRLLQEGIVWFGAPTPLQQVAVRSPYQIIGHVDGVIREGGQTVLVGWACASYHAASIDVHVYSGGPAGAGTFVTVARADRTAEPLVSAACATTGVAHRFRIPLDAHELAHGDRAIFVHGISPHGYANDVIGGAGVHRIPVKSISVRYASSAELADFTGDGRADYADHHLASGNFWVHRNAGDGTFHAAAAAFGVTAAGVGWRVLAADFTGDGWADYADVHEASGTVWIHENLRNGSFNSAAWATATTTAGTSIELLPGDFDGDGRADILERDVSTGVLRVRRNHGPGTNQFVLQPTASFVSASGAEWRVLVADFTGDGRADIADLHIPSAQVWIHQGSGSDFHRSDWGHTTGTPGSAWKAVVGDFDADGFADLGDLHIPSGQMWIHQNLRGGVFMPPGIDLAHARTNRAAPGWDLLGE